MGEHTISFAGNGAVVVPTGTLLTEAAVRAGVQIAQPCGGQGRCGRCAVQVHGGEDAVGGVRRRSTLRLSAADVAAGYALACQAVVEGDAQVIVPTQETLERTLTTDRTAVEVTVPLGYDPQRDQTIHRLYLTLPPPSLDDQRDDWSRLQTAVRTQTSIEDLQISLPLLRQIGSVLRVGEWRVTAVLNTDYGLRNTATLLALLPGHIPDDTPLLGLAVDIGTTTVSVWLVDLISGAVLAQAAEYNRQIRCGEDVISRVMYASKNNGQAELRQLVLQSINTLIERVVQKAGGKWQVASGEPGSRQVMKATIVGNSIMMHMLLGIPAESIRLSPFVTAVNHPLFSLLRKLGWTCTRRRRSFAQAGCCQLRGRDITAGSCTCRCDRRWATARGPAPAHRNSIH